MPYLLGRTKQETWSFAMDASAYSKQEQLHDIAKQKGTPHFSPSLALWAKPNPAPVLAPFSTASQESFPAAGFVMQDLRSMVAHLSGTDLAVAGHAVALAGWHQVDAWSCLCKAHTRCFVRL